MGTSTTTSADDGFSIDGGYGLFSIRERPGLLGGDVSVDSRPAAGTRVVVRMPARH